MRRDLEFEEIRGRVIIVLLFGSERTRREASNF
jgi:hypothetical protein